MPVFQSYDTFIHRTFIGLISHSRQLLKVPSKSPFLVIAVSGHKRYKIEKTYVRLEPQRSPCGPFVPDRYVLTVNCEHNIPHSEETEIAPHLERFPRRI